MPRQKRMHWTQTPAGREKLATIRAAARQRKNGSNGVTATVGPHDVPSEFDLHSYRTGYRDGFEDGRRVETA